MHKLDKYNITEKTNFCSQKNNVNYNFYYKQQFINKNVVLTQHFTQIMPLLFLEKIFNNNKYINGVIAGTGFEQVFFDDIVYYYQRNDFYIYYNSYLNDFVSSKTLKAVYFFVVDIDYINKEELITLIAKTIKRMKFKPNYIVNSGSGIHCLYQIYPEQAYKHKLNQLNAVNTAIQQRFSNSKAKYKVDVHGLTQAYRLPGSQTKLWQSSTIWQVHKNIYTAKELAVWLGIKWNTKIKLKNSKNNTNTRKNNIATMPNAYNGNKFYLWLLGNKHKINVGHRYMYLFGLCIAAYKCKVSKNILMFDLEQTLKYFNRRDNVKIKSDEINKALNGYSNKFVHVRWETMQSWFHTINNTVKRNYRDRKTHLRICNYIKKAEKESRASKAIKLYSKGYTQKHIANILGVTDRTVRNYLKK